MDTNLFLPLMAKVIVLFTAMPVHEFAHAQSAALLGDSTPGEQGRLTLNPFAHLSLFGAAALLLLGFGWAKPVMVNPRNFKNPRVGMAVTSAAGPLSNLLMALVALIAYKLANAYLPYYAPSVAPLIYILYFMALINIQLAVFNLIPIPPLDGSKILGIVLPRNLYRFVLQYERYIMILLIVLIYTNVLYPPLFYLCDKVLGFMDTITMPLDMMLRGR